MKKSIKLIIVALFTFIAVFVGNETVYADSEIPTTFEANTYSFTKNPLGLTGNINVKKTSDGKYIYCYDVNKELPRPGITYVKGNFISDPAISYIISSGANDQTDYDFFATQAALWIYLYDTNQMSDNEYGYINKIKTAIYGSKYYNDSVAIDIRNILANAKNASYASNEVVFEIVNNNVNFTIVDGYYVSDVIRINSNVCLDDYSVIGLPYNAEVVKVSNGFKVKIPDSNVKPGENSIGVVVHKNVYVNEVYKYNAGNSSYQDMLVSYPKVVTVHDSIPLTTYKEEYEEEYEEEDIITIVVSKKDAKTEKELPGATLVIKNSKGKELYRWVSGSKPYIIEGIKEGTYTLEEIKAPDGYILNKNIYTFEVKNNGVVAEIVMYNTPEHTEIVVPPTGLNATKISYILGGLVIIIGSVLIYKNVRKEQ